MSDSHRLKAPLSCISQKTVPSFSDNGLAVTARDYDPPSLAIRDVAAGKLDLAGSSEYPVVLIGLAGANFSIIARYDATQTVYLIARKDRGIANISNLRGKKIGVPKGTIADFDLSFPFSSTAWISGT